MNHKYYNQQTELLGSAYFRFRDKSGKFVKNPYLYVNPYANKDVKGPNEEMLLAQYCFAPVTYNSVPGDVQSILVSHPTANIPYAEQEIERWIGELCEIGFPCRYMGIENEFVHVEVNLRDYDNKPHYCATLMLIRVLWENAMAQIPDIYFQALDDNPQANKFRELQEAHKHPGLPNFNTNHTVTNKMVKNVTKEVLFKRFRDSGIGVYGGRVGQLVYWTG